MAETTNDLTNHKLLSLCNQNTQGADRVTFYSNCHKRTSDRIESEIKNACTSLNGDSMILYSHQTCFFQPIEAYQLFYKWISCYSFFMWNIVARFIYSRNKINNMEFHGCKLFICFNVLCLCNNFTFIQYFLSEGNLQIICVTLPKYKQNSK